jgi:hypothetical protein
MLELETKALGVAPEEVLAFEVVDEEGKISVNRFYIVIASSQKMQV